MHGPIRGLQICTSKREFRLRCEQHKKERRILRKKMNLLRGEEPSCVVSDGGSVFSGAPLSLTLLKCQKHCRDCGDACQCMMNGKDIKTGEPVEGVEQPDASSYCRSPIRCGTAADVHHPIAEAIRCGTTA